MSIKKLGNIELNEVKLFNSTSQKPLKNTESSLRSDAVTEIISNRPGFSVRWGITLFFLILVMVVCICWLIQYPDLVTSKAKLTSINSPKEVVCKTDDKLVKLYVKEGETVATGDLIGLMGSIASHQEVIDLSEKLDKSIQLFELNLIEESAKLLNHHYEHLGELQADYQQFSTSLQQFNDYSVNHFYKRKHRILEVDFIVLRKMAATIRHQQELAETDVELASESFKMNQKLVDDKVISKDEFRTEQSKFLNKQQSIPQLQASVLSNINQQADKQKELNQLQHDMEQEQMTFEQAVQTLKSIVDDWKKKYLFVAPIDGKVSFASFFQINQQLKIGQTLCFINPENSSYYAEMLIPQNNFGKVKIGSMVLLKFPSYPFQEYGSVMGSINFISHIPSDSGYLAKVVLTQGLTTNYHTVIQYREGLTAEAQIITQPMRLLERFYYSILKVTKR